MAKMFIGGEWQDRDDKIPVYNPYDGSVVDTVPNASKEDVDLAFKTAIASFNLLVVLSFRKPKSLILSVGTLKITLSLIEIIKSSIRFPSIISFFIPEIFPGPYDG